MSEFDTSPGAGSRSEAERAAAFAELMRIERSQNRPPISGLGVAALGTAVVFTVLAYLFGLFALVIGATALVFGVFALPQIRHKERRGLGFVLAALMVLAAGVVVILLALNEVDNLVR